MSVKNALDLFAKRIKQQALTNLTKAKKKNTSNLYNSIKHEVKVSKRSFELTISMADYGKFVDKGVKGKTSTSRAPNSPFRFGSGTGAKGGLTNGINFWVTQKRIQFKNQKTGKFMSYKSTAWLIIKSIYNKGIAPTNFITKPFENEFKKLPQEIVEAYGLTIKSLIKTTLK
jgi:hypothetical protein